MREKELVQRADIALADLINNGGYMQPEMANRFTRKMMAEPTILREVRTIRMGRPKMDINKIGFQGRMLQAAKNSSVQGGSTAIGNRAPTRYKPTTSKISMETSEVIAEIDLPYEVLEDAIEGGAIDGTQFQETIVDMMAAKAAVDLEELLIMGDTATVGDDYLALQDGMLKRTVSNVVNQNGLPMDADLFASMIKTLPLVYHRLLGQMRFWVPTTKEIDYRMQVAQRQTALGDATLTGTAPVSVLGVPMRSSPALPTDRVLLTVPSNIIWGIQRDIRMEYDRIVRERVIVIVITARVAVQIEEEDMMVKAINVA